MFKAISKATMNLAIWTALSAAWGSALADTVYERGNTSEPQSLDPHKTSTVSEAHILRDLFEGLVMPDAKGNLIPGAAESWSVSDDGTVYTFKLRAGATWSNGDPVTAEDFVYAFGRLQNPETGAEYASMLYVIKNAAEINAGKAMPEEIGARAVDSRTLEVTLKAPTPYFLEILTHQAAYPVHRPSVEKSGAAWSKPGTMVSNGAFTLAEWVPDDHVSIVKNPTFHAAVEVRLDRVNYHPTKDSLTAMKRFEAGEIDSNDDLPTEQLAELRAKFGDQVRIGPYLGLYYYAVKLDKAPWSDPNIRRAISMAIDRDFLAEKVWGGTMIPAYSMVPPGIAGYTPSEAHYGALDQLAREDEAARLLAEAGYGPDNPLKLELRIYNSDNNQNNAVAIQEGLNQLGVKASILNTDVGTHYGVMENRGDFDLGLGGWIADYKDPETFLGLGRKASGNNFSHYESPEFERLMDEAAAAGAEPEKRMRLLAEAEKVLIDDLAFIPMLYFSYHNVVSSRVSGWEDNVLDVHPSRFITVNR
jgi:oligopeptide transport system substrate-binding protein